MLLRIIADPRLPVMLSRIDFDLAKEARGRGCPFCGAALHSARYPRKPRCEKDLDPQRRFSFCCAAEGCRKRTTPPSVRFLGRRVYPAIVVVLLSAFTQGVSARRACILRSALGVDRRTLGRWLLWWRKTFPRTVHYKAQKARFFPPLDQESLPLSLLLRFGKGALEGILSLLRFLCPWSTGSPHAHVSSAGI